jgi:hypothetical protein
MMPTEYYLNIVYLVAFRLVELVTAAGVVYGAARLWATNTDSSLLRFVRHSKRTWIALGLFFVTMIVNHGYFYLRITHNMAVFQHFGLNLLVSLILNIFCGIAFGLIGCLLASVEMSGQRFKHWEAFGISAGLVFLFFATQIFLGPFRMYNHWISLTEILVALVFATFLAARAFPHRTPEALPDGTQPVKLNSPAIALSLAFLPSVLLLLTLPFLNGKLDAGYLISCCALSAICCFTASCMLFRRGTGLAIFGGIIFLMLNGFVSFLFGCGAILTGMKF